MPAYNEEFHIFSNIQRTIKALNEFNYDYKIIIVDDGSKDRTYEEARKAENISSKVKVVRVNFHKGKGHALKYGFQFTRGDLVAFLDADLDLPPKQINLFWKTMEKNKSDVVIGSRRHFQSNSHYPIIRQTLSLIYRAIVHILFNLSITDTQVGLKLFKYKVLKNTIPNVSVKGYAFDLELLVNAYKLNYKIVAVPVVLNFQRNNTWKKIKSLDIYRMFIDTLAIFYRTYARHY